jgi:Trypsin-like peptidase domain
MSVAGYPMLLKLEHLNLFMHPEAVATMATVNKASIARVIVTDSSGTNKHIGMAIVTDDRHILTCCHVLNAAIGENKLKLERPNAGTEFTVCFPYAGSEIRTARLRVWGFDHMISTDVAVLVLDKPVPAGVDSAVFSDAEVEEKEWSCTGYDRVGNERAVNGICGPVLSRGERQLNGAGVQVPQITDGYSGGGVWSGGTPVCVGMAVLKDFHQIENGLAYAIPTRAIREVWPRLRGDHDHRVRPSYEPQGAYGLLINRSGLVGREKELNYLNDWPQGIGEFGDARVVCIMAIGGMGKSALTWQWYKSHVDRIFPGGPPAGKMWYSFYEPGATFSNFLTHALSFTAGISLSKAQAYSDDVKEDQLVDALNRSEYLLVLDGLERLMFLYSVERRRGRLFAR